MPISRLRLSAFAPVLLCLGLLVGCTLDAPPPGGGPATPVAATAPASTGQVAAIEQENLMDPTDPRDFAPINPVRMAVIWYDLPVLRGRDFVATQVLLAKQGPETRMSFALPRVNTTCDGAIRFSAGNPAGLVGGDFDFACSNGEAVRGILVPVRGQRAINGQGVDSAGRSVVFSIEMTQ